MRNFLGNIFPSSLFLSFL